MKRVQTSLLLANEWKDYALLDAGDGMKRERWGDVVLVRPDPQIVWPRRAGKRWDSWDGWYHRSRQGGGRWEFRRALPEYWTIGYKDLSFRIRPTSFKHTGLFPEQAVNWDWFSDRIRRAGKPVSVLNLFGYTGGATVAAASAGASVCHVDAADGMVRWCRENAVLSGLAAAPIRYIADDCLKFVRREIRRGNRYDAVIMDPPSYGRGSQGQMWKLEKSLWELLEACREVLTQNPLFFLLNAYTARLSPTVIRNLLAELFHGRDGRLSAGEIGLPVEADGKVLPCGVFGRWERESESEGEDLQGSKRPRARHAAP